jgi:hypothetical protein
MFAESSFDCNFRDGGGQTVRRKVITDWSFRVGILNKEGRLMPTISIQEAQSNRLSSHLYNKLVSFSSISCLKDRAPHGH